MSYRQKKSLNLIPESLRYDYIKDILIKISTFTILLVLCFTVFDYLYLSYKNRKIEKEIVKLEDYNNSLKKQISSLSPFDKEYKALETKLKTAITIKNELKSFYAIHHSALLSSIIAMTSKPKGIYFYNITYNKGLITIDGYTSSSKKFYEYYKSLEINNHIKKVKFHYIKQENGLFKFKIDMEIKKADELS